MSDDSLRFEFNRMPRFEMTTVTSISTETGIDTRTAGRPSQRTQVGTVVGANFYPGERALMSAGGDNDVPLIFAKSPYLF